MELPTIRCYGPPLARLVDDGSVPENLLDRSVRRVLTMKCELGLLDDGWSAALDDLAGQDDLDHLDPPEHRALARQLAEQSVVVLANDGVLPLAPVADRVALIGPLADDSSGMLGCYTFPSRVGAHHPDVPIGVDVPTLAAALRDDLGSEADRDRGGLHHLLHGRRRRRIRGRRRGRPPGATGDRGAR